MASARGRARASGFSMIELMVSLTVGGIAISAIYAISAASTKQFHQQQQIAHAQTKVRVAINQLKRDIARAGFLGTPNAGLPGVACLAPPSALHDPPNHSIAAIARFTNNIAISSSNNNNNVDPTGNNAAVGVSVDEVVLLGNYETASEYSGIELTTVGTNDEIAISGNFYSWQYDFTDWPGTGGSFVDNAFERAFPDGRLVHIRTRNGLSHFAQVATNGQTYPIAGPPAENAKLRLTIPVPNNCTAHVKGGWVAPLNAIRYYVRNAPTTGGDLNAQRYPQGHGPIAQLVREEVLPTDKTTPLNVAGNPRISIIADYVVAFNLAFTMTQDTGPNAADQYAIAAVTDAPDMPATSDGPDTTNVAATVNAAPQRVRAVLIDLAVRTPEQDESMTWSTATCANLRCFQVFSDRPGFARVRRLRTEVMLPNVAKEGF